MAKYRDRRLMVYVPSSLGEDRVLWGGCMKRRVPRNTLGRKIDNFWSTYAWTTSSDAENKCRADGQSHAWPLGLWAASPFTPRTPLTSSYTLRVP